MTDNRSWAFEFKQHFCFANVRPDTLQVRLDRAVENAGALDRSEADERFGALIVGARDGVECSEEFIARVDRIMAGMQLSYRIDGGCGPAWIAFESVD